MDDELREFEAGYAERSGVTVTWLHEHGVFAVRCDRETCSDDECTGWAMTSVESFADHMRFRGVA